MWQTFNWNEKVGITQTTTFDTFPVCLYRLKRSGKVSLLDKKNWIKENEWNKIKKGNINKKAEK
jgi:hypothetical protein